MKINYFAREVLSRAPLLIEVESKTSMSVEDLYIPLDHCVVIVNSYYIIVPNKIVHLSQFEEPAAVYVHKGINFYFQH